MSRLLSDQEYMLDQVRSMEDAANRIAGYNVRLRSFLLELVDPDGLGHAVSDEVRKRAQELLSNGASKSS